MKFTLSWLKDYLDTSASAAEIAETLTAIGLEVEAVQDAAASLKDFIVAEIVEAVPHPNAGKLQVCKVNDGEGVRQVVCGAANARAGLKVVLAREGVFIPGSGITIKKTKIRDVESNGMLCSAEELGLGEASEGIIELPTDAAPGAPAASALGADDPVIEIAVTPNRADALGVYGIARDLAAAGLGTLKPLAAPAQAATAQSWITLATPHCPYFVGCHIRGVKNGASPEWMQRRLRAIGLRPISALVDITNYFTFAFGRPLHVFDTAKLTGNITVRAGRSGETLKALNGKTYALTPEMTVIADDAGALALGGIIGGEASGCTETTTDVFLEAAYFDPVNIAKTGRALELLSDARYRFERGVDPAFVEAGARLAAQMIMALCGGEAGGLEIAGAEPAWRREIAFSPKRVKKLGGVDVAAGECERILVALGFAIHEGSVVPPSWRGDVEGEADVVEEILRIHGYKHIPSTPLPAAAKPALAPAMQRVSAARRVLAGRGMLECCTWSFLPEAHAALFGGGAQELKVQNPISAELSMMRPSLLPNLLTALCNNANRGFKDSALFEVGAVFSGVSPEAQKTYAAGVRAGHIAEHDYGHAGFQAKPREADVFDAKADVLALLAALGVNTNGLTISGDTPPGYMHPGRSGAIMQGRNVLGWFGEIHPSVAARFDIEGRVAAFEINLDALPPAKAKSKARPPLNVSDFQAVTRDFAFLVDAKVKAADIIKAIAGAEKQLIREVRIFDVFIGKGVEAGKKSVAVQVTLQAGDRTLSDADITAASSAIVNAAGKEFGGQLRA